MVRVSDALYVEAQKLAEAEDRPLSYLILEIIASSPLREVVRPRAF
jgi:predicted transcriptional regulator